MPADLVTFTEEILNRKLQFFLQWQKLVFAPIWGNSPLKDNIILLTLNRRSFYVCLMNIFVKGLVFRSSLDANLGNGFRGLYRRVPKLPKAHPLYLLHKKTGYTNRSNHRQVSLRNFARLAVLLRFIPKSFRTAILHKTFSNIPYSLKLDNLF